MEELDGEINSGQSRSTLLSPGKQYKTAEEREEYRTVHL